MSNSPGPVASHSPRLTGETRVVGVIGTPIRHSLSPVIHNAAFAAMGLDWVSVAFPVAADAGPVAMESMRTLDIAGLSVTMPHKATVIPALDALAGSAESLGVANCIHNDGGRLVGHNTDGDGFVRSLRRDLDIDPATASVAILGAGGAARSIVEALGRSGAPEIVVINRTKTKAADVAQLADTARVGEPSDVSAANLIVNTTSVGMAGADASGATPDMPSDPALFRAGQAVIDIVYNPAETAWLRAARSEGLRAINGVPMLVQQAAIALEIWTGVTADVDAMQQATDEALAGRAAERR